jgi:PhnB protein
MRCYLLPKKGDFTMVQKKPDDMRSVIPALMMKNAAKAIEFYESVLGASVKSRMDMPDGKVAHAELTIGDSSIMLGDECPEMNMPSTSNNTYVYVGDVDGAFKKAIEKGASEILKPEDQFWGDRTACFRDPFGQQWTIAVHVEDVSEEEVRRRGKEMFSKAA